jgi:hypothetical protein
MHEMIAFEHKRLLARLTVLHAMEVEVPLLDDLYWKWAGDDAALREVDLPHSLASSLRLIRQEGIRPSGYSTKCGALSHLVKYPLDGQRQKHAIDYRGGAQQF